ncbi:hypothetical protein [Sedimentibacter sp.]|uniref:hypothetical protein n=1 Tax=Sedimentibacter sp. TaxID=1960295 RepID=UPI002896990F|nr:hypothetical protein [Sedimentibacter sp.]
MLLNVRFYGGDTEEFIEVEVVPAFQTYNTTKFISSQTEKERIYSLLEDMSINIEINDAGIVTGVSP